MSRHDPHHPDHPLQHPLTRAVDAVITGVEHVLHSRQADMLRHALIELLVRVFEQVAATSSRMSVLAHQRIETLAARVNDLEQRVSSLEQRAPEDES
jgi:hypothetical protein